MWTREGPSLQIRRYLFHERFLHLKGKDEVPNGIVVLLVCVTYIEVVTTYGVS